MLLTGNVLASVSNNGLRANVIPVVGLDWAFLKGPGRALECL